MDVILNNTLNRLEDIERIKYLDSDWGQLDYYSPNMPVKFPAVLIDINQAQFSNIGRDFKAEPQNRQQAQAQMVITVADLRLGNTSAKAPETQKNYTLGIWGLIKDIHKAMHGFIPDETAGALIRTNMQRTNRDDGVQEYKIYYGFAISNV